MSGAEAAQVPVLKVIGSETVVVRGDPCGNMAIPDAPARALRLSDKSVVLIAAHRNNIPVRGQSLDKLEMTCGVSSEGSGNPDPEAFDDRFWVQALAPLSEGKILGIASHEYNGQRYDGMCETSQRGGCWYSSIIFTEAQTSKLEFKPLPLLNRVLAQPNTPYDPKENRRKGFFSVSNILKRNGYAYMFAYAEQVDGVRIGNCLLRASVSDLFSWSIYSKGKFIPLHRTGHCSPVGLEATAAPFRSVVFVEPLGKYISVYMRGQGRDEGVYYSLSADLMNWSEPQILLDVKNPYGKTEKSYYYYYPSLIDKESQSNLFDRASSKFDLYLTRYNFQNGSRDHRNRDLVRFPVEVQN
jgi:hypothetical protein